MKIPVTEEMRRVRQRLVMQRQAWGRAGASVNQLDTVKESQRDAEWRAQRSIAQTDRWQAKRNYDSSAAVLGRLVSEAVEREEG